MTPIDLATNTPESPFPFGGYPSAIAITPDGRTAYVTGSPISGGSGTVTPIDLATDTSGTSMAVSGPQSIAITPDGSTAFVASGYGQVVPIDLATNTPGTPIMVGGDLDAIAITPNGLSAYVASSGAMDPVQMTFGSGSVTPIDLATNTPGHPISVSSQLPALAITSAVFGAPTARITDPANNATYTVGQTVMTSFSCTDASDGPGISSCKDSSQLTSGSGSLNTASAGARTYTVKHSARTAGRPPRGSRTPSSPRRPRSRPPRPSPPQRPPLRQSPRPPLPRASRRPTPPVTPPGRAVRTQISRISLTTNLNVWCHGHGCRYPCSALQFTLNHAATVRLALRTRASGHWKQVATTNLHGHRGINRDLVAGRWHGRLVPPGPAQIPRADPAGPSLGNR